MSANLSIPDTTLTQIVAGSGDQTLIGTGANELIIAGNGNDILIGGNGNDTLIGGSGNDILIGGNGTNLLQGGPGRQLLIGGNGNNMLVAGPGDNILVGGKGDNLLQGGAGNDVLIGGTGNDILIGGSGNELLIAGNGNSRLVGGSGTNVLIGGSGDNTLVSGSGRNTITGGTGKETFLYQRDPFDGQTPTAPAAGQILGVNTPDTITDFDIGRDTFALSAASLGLKGLTFADGAVNDLSGNANVLVLQGEFANARVAAQAIADNNNITADAGVFIYHNSTLGINRLVYSADLSKGGAFSVLANMTNQAGDAGVSLLPNYSAQNFSIV